MTLVSTRRLTLVTWPRRFGSPRWRSSDRRCRRPFAVLDAAEVAHQLHENRTALALLAGLIAALHAAAALAIHKTTTAATVREPARS